MSEDLTLKYKHLAIAGAAGLALFFTILVAVLLFYGYWMNGQLLGAIFGWILFGLGFVEIYYIAEGKRVRCIEVNQDGVRYFRHGRVVATIPLGDLESITFTFTSTEGEVIRRIDFKGRRTQLIKAQIESAFRSECPAFDLYQATLERWCAEHGIQFTRFIKNDQGDLWGEKAADLYEKYTGFTPTGQRATKRIHLTNQNDEVGGKKPGGVKRHSSKWKILGYGLMLAFLFLHVVILVQAFSLYWDFDEPVRGHQYLQGTVPGGQVLLIRLYPSASSPPEVIFNITFPDLDRTHSTTLKLHIPEGEGGYDYYPSEWYTLIPDSKWDSAYFPHVADDDYSGFTFAVDDLPPTGLIEYQLNLTPSSGEFFFLTILNAPFYRASITLTGILSVCFAPMVSITLLLFPHTREYGVYKYGKKVRFAINFTAWGSIAGEILILIHLFFLYAASTCCH